MYIFEKLFGSVRGAFVSGREYCSHNNEKPVEPGLNVTEQYEMRSNNDLQQL